MPVNNYLCHVDDLLTECFSSEFKYGETKKVFTWIYESGRDRKNLQGRDELDSFSSNVADNQDVSLVQATLEKRGNKVYIHGRDNLIIT